MTNKKLWLSLLSIALIVCMLSVGLISCKPKEEPTPTPTEQVEVTAMKAIINGLKKSVEDGDMTDLKLNGELGIKINEDTEYTLDLQLDLDLLQKGESATTSNTFLEANLKKGNDTILGVYYYDAQQAVDEAHAYDGNTIYVQYKSKTEGQKKLSFTAPNVAAVQKYMDGQVDFSNIDLQDEDIWEDTILKYALMVAALAEEGSCTDSSASLALNLGTLLDPDNEEGLADLVSGLVDFDALDLDADAGLVSILPNIKLVLSADLEDGKVTGLNLSLEIEKKNIEVKHKSNNGKVLVINIDKDINVELSLTYTVGEASKHIPSDIQTYIDNFQENIIDVALSVDLYLGEQLGASFDLNGNKLTVAAQPGYYTLALNIAANPWKVISKINHGLSFDGTANIINSIKEIINVVESLEIKLTKVAEKNGTELSTPDTVLDVLVATNFTSSTQGGTTVYTRYSKMAKIITMNLITGYPFPSAGISIDEAIDLVLKFIPKSGKAETDDLSDATLAPASTADDDDNTELFQTIAGYLLGAYIGINDGVAGHGKIYASFDTNATTEKMIPFGGYTKWTGSYNSAYQYYVVDEEAGYDKVEASAQFDASKKYYTLEKAKFVKVDTTKTTFDSMRQYYTYSTADSKYVASTDKKFETGTTYYVYEAAKYKEAEGITSFASGTTYYTYHDTTYKAVTITAFAEDTDYYVKGKSDGGDFGITLSATLNLVDDNIVIEATVGNLDIFGLPASLEAKISNVKIKLWSQDFNVLVGGNTVKAYSEIA